MTTKRIKVIDVFDQSTCGVCGGSEINQYFGVNDHFIEYSCGAFLSIREVLSSALDFQVIILRFFLKRVFLIESLHIIIDKC